ncbi:MAG: trigger factor [Nitrospirae bacterium]|nr:trigger factor [Nitrospirota bacterium]
MDIEEVSKVKRIIKIEVPSDIVSKEYSEAYENVRKNAKVPGFRKGKLPLNVIERRYKDDIESDIIKKLVPEYYYKAIKDSGLTPVDMPQIENVEVSKGSPLSFTATVEISPKIESVDYAGVELKKEDVTVSDEEIAAGIEEIREKNAQLEVCDETHAIVKGDYLRVDYEGFAGGKQVKELKKEGVEFQTGAEMVAPEIDSGLLGAHLGEEQEIRIPEGDVIFKVKITEVKKKILPEINDDLARDTGEGETLAGLMEKVKERVKERKEDELKASYKGSIIKKLIELNPVEIPPSLIEKEMKNFLARTKKFMGKKDAFEADEEKALREKYTSHAEELVKSDILITAIADIEGINAAEEDVEAEIKRMAARSQQDEALIKRYITSVEGGIDNIKDKIREDKVIALILSKVKWV